MALTVVVCATVVQAASFNWTSSGTNASKTFYGTDGNTIAGMTVYLFDAATVSQGDLLAGLRSGDTIADYTVVASQTLDTNSRLSAKGFEYGTAGETYSFYMAIVDGDNVLFLRMLRTQMLRPPQQLMSSFLASKLLHQPITAMHPIPLPVGIRQFRSQPLAC